ncbi:MAG: hypothetical protein WAW92_00025 [Minisyncoccia bacterium]
MSIKEIIEKVKSPMYFIAIAITLGVILFGLGRLSAESSKKTPISITYNSANAIFATSTSGQVEATSTKENISTSTKKETVIMPVPEVSSEVIGSKSGRKYYFPWCGTVKRIKPENRVYFKSIEEARTAGFSPGGNCKGLN